MAALNVVRIIAAAREKTIAQAVGVTFSEGDAPLLFIYRYTVKVEAGLLQHIASMAIYFRLPTWALLRDPRVVRLAKRAG